MIRLFAESDKYAKKIRKTDSLNEYKSIISRLFQELEIDNTPFCGF